MKLTDATAVLAERLSSRGLYPFYVTVVFYFTLYQPCVILPAPSLSAAVCKALPVWTLAFYVRLTSRDDVGSQRYLPSSLYHQNVILALLFSSLGDIFLIFDTDLFEDGMVCFVIAQMFYFSVIRGAWTENPVRYIFMFACLVTFSFVLNYIDDAIMDAFFLFYLTLLYVMGWRATSRLLKEEWTPEGLSICTGSILFIVSETMLTLSKIVKVLPVIDFLGTVLYYAAHLSYCLTTGPVVIPLRLETLVSFVLKDDTFT